MKKENSEITLKDILHIFVPKIWLVGIVAVLCALAMFLYSSFFVKDTYTSSATMFVHKNSESLTSVDISFAESMVEVFSYRLTSDDFLNEVIAELQKQYSEYRLTSSYLRNVISFKSKGNGVVQISVTTNDPQLSYALAICVENLAPSAITPYVQDVLIMESFQSPKIPAAANSKGTVQNIIIGFLVGIVIAVAIILVFSMTDNVIRDKKKFEDNFDIQILALVPANNIKSNMKLKGESNVD